jgi:dolichol-phosphate mannosyltransferase
MQPAPKFCVIVPCYNEQESIPALVQQFVPVLETATGGSWNILFVDDGSADTTARLIWDLHQKDARFRGIRLSRNFGHQPAVATGVRHARGEVIGIIDCDLQDPPDVLVAMYQKVANEGYDVCSGARGKREDTPAWLRFCYKGFYRIMARLAEHPFTLDSGDFSVFNQRAHQALLALPEAAPVLRGLRSWVGFRQTTISYQRPPRRHGTSKYNLMRLATLGLSNVVNFSTAPLRLATLVGLGMGVLTLLAAAVFTLNRFVPAFKPLGYDINANAGTATVVLYLSFIASALFFCLGIIGEYLGVIIKEVKKRPVTVVMETTDGLDTPI